MLSPISQRTADDVGLAAVLLDVRSHMLALPEDTS